MESYVLCKSFCHYRDVKREFGHRDIYYAKKYLIFSYVWRLEFFVKKGNMYEANIFPRPLQQTCSLETTPFCLNIMLGVKKNFKFTLILLKLM